MHSFLAPYDDECALLAIGVPTFNAVTRDFFLLRGYNIFEMGDILAIEKALNIKGHNGFCPCRTCEIKGVRNVSGGEKIYYVPLTQPDGRSWDPNNLPMRSPARLAKVIETLSLPTTTDSEEVPRITAKSKEDISKYHGIKGLPALRRVGSLHYGKSAPWDVMHLIFENNVQNLVKLWSGNFKGLDTGTEDYEIPEEIWEQIWQETADAVQHLPADFVRVLGSNPAYYTAEAWCFWFVYLAPVLLKGRFSDPKYHLHACQFSDIIKSCLRFTITHTEIHELRRNIIDWVRKYERYSNSTRCTSATSTNICQILLPA
ncbi:hypothetical protein B0H15DRAFT_785280 [Mycena belliarum]|uniref:Uncharacterized protein n=1 Tax=Mycena belliarum TaxID=1033014 RepID=A0AAD6XP17_9AGAR|nr:hypothetical protein B0H15DRAFT_785280 [Mycena belliae]